MARMRRKADLPSKICAACGLPFNWRKKWARDWDNVKFCSERCRRNKGNTSSSEAVGGKQTASSSETIGGKQTASSSEAVGDKNS